MIARVTTLFACMFLVGCASARPWRASSTASTSFEGEQIEVASGHAVLVSCETARGDSKDYPLWGCTDRGRRESETRLRWGARTSTLRVPGYLHEYAPVPRLRGLHVRRLAPQLVAFEIRAGESSWQGDVFLCLQRPDGCRWAPTPLALPRDGSLEQAHALAMARPWRADELDALFGDAPAHHAHAVEHRDWHYLGLRWPVLSAEMRGRALSAAIDARKERFLKDHWDELDEPAVQRALELFVDVDRYAFLAEESWWTRLSPAMQRHLDALAVDGVASSERQRYLERRLRATGSEQLRRALERRW